MLLCSSLAHRGGLRLGGLAAVYYGASMLTSVYRNRRDYWSHAVGSTASGSLLGFSGEALAGVAGAGRGREGLAGA